MRPDTYHAFSQVGHQTGYPAGGSGLRDHGGRVFRQELGVEQCPLQVRVVQRAAVGSVRPVRARHRAVGLRVSVRRHGRGDGRRYLFFRRRFAPRLRHSVLFTVACNIRTPYERNGTELTDETASNRSLTCWVVDSAIRTERFFFSITRTYTVVWIILRGKSDATVRPETRRVVPQ